MNPESHKNITKFQHLRVTQKNSPWHFVTSRARPATRLFLARGTANQHVFCAIGTNKQQTCRQKAKLTQQHNARSIWSAIAVLRPSLELLTPQVDILRNAEPFHRLLRSFATAYCAAFATACPRNRAYQHLQSSTKALNH